MASLNKQLLIGNLGADVELRYTQSGQAVCNLRIATSERYKNQAGEPVEKTEWHSVVCWGKTAELCAQYLAKGRTVYVEGRTETRQWTDREGNNRESKEIVASVVQFLGEPRAQAPQGGQPAPQHGGQSHGGWGDPPPNPAGSQGGGGWGEADGF